jgi:hypothetical protein
LRAIAGCSNTLAVTRTLLADIRGNVREFFLLEQAERRSSMFSASQRQSVRAYYDAARRRLFAAKTLCEPSDAPSGLLLYREAWWCLTRAILLSDDADVDVIQLSPDVAWAKLDRALAGRNLPVPTDVECAKALLVAADPLILDRLSPEEASRNVDTIDAATRWLSGLVEARSPGQLKRIRIVRQAVAALFACVLALGIVMRLAAPRDLALHKPVQSTPAAYETTASGAVDGEKNGRFGFHSEETDSPFLRIDLEKVFSVKTIKIFGRGECCFDQSIPLALEISTDGVSFRKIAERTVLFSESDPWVVDAGSVATRFVRLRVEHRAVLVLSEVEVYGKLAK